MNLFKRAVISLLTLESRLILAKYRPFVVAVTGSVGKTSTKDAIYCVLKNQSHYVRKSEKSLNSEIGLPLTVIGAPNAWHSLRGWLANIWKGFKLIAGKSEYPDCLILEVGADHPGDIKKIAGWLLPDIAVITRISRLPVHVEFFKSPEQVFEEKAALAEALKAGGALVLFADDEKVMSIAERVKSKQPRVISFGLNPFAAVRASEPAVDYSSMNGNRGPSGLSFSLEMGGARHGVSVKNVIGQTYEYPLLAAAAVGQAKGMNVEAIAKALSGFEAPRGRLNLIPGINGSTLIDDTYNSSPDAAEAALLTLKGLECSGDKIAILGDMMELGKYAAEEHRKVGRLSAGIVSRLITVGPRSKMTADEAVQSGLVSEKVQSFDSATDAASAIAPLIKSGDIVLIKGSQSVRMERVVKALMYEPERAAELLVRQEREWLEKA